MFAGSVAAQKGNSTGGIARGQAAIKKLGERLSAVAARNGKKTGELRRLFLEDSTLHIDEDSEKLLYICDAVDNTPPGFESSPIVESASFPYSETFKLHSRPGANRVIYLDFDGHVTTGTIWNTNYTGGQPINSAPFNIDSDPNTFNMQEQEVIQYIWQRVAEDYAPFDVDVTTEDPGDEAIFRSSASDSVYGTRVVISPTNFTGNPGIGGIAYVGVFNLVGTNFKPVFVMASGLSNNEKNIAEAVSHEVGHNLGLNHDGIKNPDGSTTNYYSGHGNWAPIMGIGYSRSLTQWSKGEYPGANQLQDDLAVMQNYGIPLINDDHGNTNASATVLSGSSFNASGIISTGSDVDVFRFSTGSGSISINLNTATRGANLDMQAKISDAQGNVLAVSEQTALPSSLNINLSEGVYFLSIEGVGAGDLATGYSDYGSIGQYSISGTLVTRLSQPPSASASANVFYGTTPLTVAFSSVNSSDPDGAIVNYHWNFGDGTSSTEPNPVHIYNSAGTFTAVLTVTNNSGLTGMSSVFITAVPVPNQAPVAVAGANVTSGNAFLTVNFSSRDSYDPDGTIASYVWNFGNGATSNQANPSYTYTTAGNFMATLTVTDNKGATNSKSIPITVHPEANPLVFVKNISMNLFTGRGFIYGQAVITIYDSNGLPRPNVKVIANWNGLINEVETGTTDASGRVTFTSPNTFKQSTFAITVNELSTSGYIYNPSLNVVSSGSITLSRQGKSHLKTVVRYD